MARHPLTDPKVPRSGKVVRAVRHAFVARDETVLSTAALHEWAYPRSRVQSRHNQMRRVRLAAARHCERVTQFSSGSGRPILWRLGEGGLIDCVNSSKNCNSPIGARLKSLDIREVVQAQPTSTTS